MSRALFRGGVGADTYPSDTRGRTRLPGSPDFIGLLSDADSLQLMLFACPDAVIATDRDDRILLPGHGGPVADPPAFLRGLRAHRRMRERAIIERLRAGDRLIAAIVAQLYRDVDPRLHGAAGLSVLAHLEDLVGRGEAQADGPVALDAAFRPA